MSEELDEVAGAFSTEIAPASRPRDQAGKFVATTSKPEPMLGPRPIEGDTRDGGDDPALRARERAIADAREPEDTEVEEVERDPERISNEVVADEGDESSAETDDGDKYDVTVDGEPREVTLKEALAGYIRTETFHKRHAQLLNVQQELEAEYGRIQQNWALWHKAKADYEEDLVNMIPREPNWDQEFARDPHAAHELQKIYQTLYGKLAASQGARVEREAMQKAERDRQLEKYAVEAFAKFVSMHPKVMPDQAAVDKNLASMRRTAAAAGFTDYEIATVYDPRMLTILLKASKYDRMQASRPKPVIVDKGKTLSPGAATPLGNARRSGFDDAQRRLASSGRLQDAVEVFRRML